MKSKNLNYMIRKTHRYLGVFIGLQFIGWTVSGLFFSWNDLDSVHGDHLKKAVKSIPANFDAISPQIILENLKLTHQVDAVKSIQLISILDKMYYQVGYFSNHDQHMILHYALADAATGNFREALSKEEAEKMAIEIVIDPAKIETIEFLTEVGKHHEYRERRLPAWAITFSEPNCTVYFSAELGTFQTIRHNQWRIFDFLWMFHTMDYAGRDNFNNWLLKLFSVFGLFTVFSGFVLYGISSRKIRIR